MAKEKKNYRVTCRKCKEPLDVDDFGRVELCYDCRDVERYYQHWFVRSLNWKPSRTRPVKPIAPLAGQRELFV